MAYSEQDVQQVLTGGTQAPPVLVNENEEQSGYSERDFVQSLLGTADPASQQAISERVAAKRREAAMPKSWFGELTHGFSRGVDMMQQTAYGVGALASDTVNLEGATEFFTKAVEQQNKEIEASPGRAETFEEVDSFDTFMRYLFSGTGEVAPNLVESVITGLAGATVGSSVGPEGTVAGGVAGLVGRKAARELIEEGVEKIVGGVAAKTVKNELTDYARGKITRDELQDVTANLLANQSRRVTGRYGATGALGMSSIGQEVGSIYTDLLQDPNMAESDRKIAALVGGFAAGTVEGLFEGYIVSRFFKGASRVTNEEANAAKQYLVDFTKAYGKEILKTVPGEGGTELAQTIIEEAAKNWADPLKRDAILEFSPEQKSAFIDATFKGMMGGMLGGGISAVPSMRTDPDPQVRMIERDILQQAEDIMPSSALDAEAGPDDTRLSAIVTRQGAIETELAKPDITPEIRTGLEEENARLEQEYNTLLGEQAAEVEPLVNEKKEEETAILSPEEQGIKKIVKSLPEVTETIRALQGKKLGDREMGEVTETLDEEATAAKFTQIQNLVTDNVKKSKAAPDLQQKYVENVMSAFDVPTVNFLAKEGVVVRKVTREELKDRMGGQRSFAAFDDDQGNIVLTIPDLDSYLSTVSKAPQESLPIFQRAQRAELDTAPDTVAHELIHVADLVHIRNQFHEDQSERSFYEFERDYIENRGQLLRNAMPSLAQTLHGTYYRSLGEANNRQLGYEFMRILVEASRTGRIGEVTDALLRAERAAEGNTQGYISAFLAEWFNSIKALYEQIQRFFNPETASPEVKRQFDDINAILDRYGVIMDGYPVELAQAPVEEQAAAEPEPEPAPEPPAPPKPTKAKLTAIDKAEARLIKTIDRAKAKKGPIVDAMLAHIRLQRELGNPIVKSNLEENARAFKELYGKGATLKLYKETAATEVLVNEKAAAKARPLKPSLASRYEVQMSRGVAHLVDKESGVEFGYVKGYSAGNVFHITGSNVSDLIKGQGAGVFMYERVIEEAFQRGQIVVSDNSVSLEAARVYDSLDRMGYNVIRSDDAILDGDSWISLSGPVYTILGVPSPTPQQIAESLGITYNGAMMGRLDLYTDTREASSSFGTTFAVPVGSSFEEVQNALREREEMFRNAPPPPDDKSAPQAKPRMSPREARKLEVAETEVNSSHNQLISDIPSREGEQRRVQGVIPLDSAASELWYNTRPHTRSTIEAQVLVNEKGGALKMAELLREDISGKSLNFQEDDNEGNWGPNAKLSAIYENVLTQLEGIVKNLEANSASTGTIGYVQELHSELYDTMRRIGNAGGSFNAYRGMNEKLMTGAKARRDYVDILTDNATKVLGKDAKKKMSKLSQELNNLWDRYAGVVTNSPKVISVIRRLQKLVDQSKFEKGFRKTVAKSIDRLKALTKKSAARAADFVSTEEDGEAYVNQAIKRIMLELTHPNKPHNEKTELELVQSVLERMGRGATEDARIPRPRGRSASMQEMMAAIMRNESLYTEFAQNLYQAYIQEHGGVNPEPELIHHAEEIYARLVNRMWERGMVRSLVNEKMEEFNVKFSEIVAGHYNEGRFAVEKIRDSIAEYMRESGVENQDLIDQLSQDIESEMNGALEEARDRFFTSSSGIKNFLKNMQTTLSDAARQHATYIESMEKKFEDELVRLGFPNTPDMPIARTLASTMQGEFNKMVQGERVKIVKRWIENASDEKDPKAPVKRKLDSAVEKVLQLANIGALRIEDVYKALEKKFDLPPFDEETATQIESIGDRIGNAQFDRQKDILRQELSDLLASKRGLKTSDAYTSWMYFSMLSGPGTQLVNIGANLTSLMGYISVEAVKHPLRIPRMLRALMRTAIGKAQIEARESFFTGYALGKTGEKYYRKGNPAELADASFKSGYKNETLQAADKWLAEATHKILRGTRSYYIGRALMASDIFFYKIAQEMAYTARAGYQPVTPGMWDQAMKAARTAMIADNQDPAASRDNKRRQLVLAHEFLEKKRQEGGPMVYDDEGNLVNEKELQWRESSQEALDATFQQEPTGFLGVLARHLERFTNEKPIGKLLIPFTRVVANVANHMLEWTPYGFARYAFVSLKDGKNPLKLWEDNKWKKESDIAIRAGLGMAAMIAIMAMAADEDDEDPDFAIYGDGPRDLNARRQLQQRGWKPNSIKVGDAYYSYLFTPLAMAFSIVGRHMDDYRDGRIASPTDISLASSAVALIESVKNQSFLASAADLMAAVDSPDPQAKVSRVVARVATIPLPNLFKQLDKVVDPSVQQATGFWETFIKEFPVVRHSLKPALNIFGEDVERTPGLVRFPGMDRFVTMQKTDDPVLNLIGERRLIVPGFSKSSKLGDESMTDEQYYEYVQIAGPRIKARISAEINSIDALPHEDAQTRIEKIATEEKAKARAILKRKYNVSR